MFTFPTNIDFIGNCSILDTDFSTNYNEVTIEFFEGILYDPIRNI